MFWGVLPFSFLGFSVVVVLVSFSFSGGVVVFVFAGHCCFRCGAVLGFRRAFPFSVFFVWLSISFPLFRFLFLAFFGQKTKTFMLFL